jgi:CrcB protein
MAQLQVLYITIFGAIGVLARYYLGLGLTQILPPPFPYSTFIINFLGAFFIGVVYYLGFEKNLIPDDIRQGLQTGFLGGFTTFSSYCLDFAKLFKSSNYEYAFIYLIISNVCCILATFAGLAIAQALFKH